MQAKHIRTDTNSATQASGVNNIFVHWGGREGAPYGGIHLEWDRTTGESVWEGLSNTERSNLAFSFHFNHSLSCEEIGAYPLYDKDVCQTAFDATGLPPHHIENDLNAADSHDLQFDVDTLLMSDDGGYLSLDGAGTTDYAWSPIVQEHSACKGVSGD